MPIADQEPSIVVAIVLAFGTLLAIVNPLSTAFVFNRLTRERPREARRALARTACITAACILLVFLAIGRPILVFFGITLYAFRFAGGIYLGKVAFDMLARRLRNEPETYAEAGHDIAIIPLAVPLLSGPGAITTVMVARGAYGWIPVAVSILAVTVVSWVVLRYARALDRAFGRTGTMVVERLLGLVVLVIAAQFVFNGITGYIEEIHLIDPPSKAPG